MYNGAMKNICSIGGCAMTFWSFLCALVGAGTLAAQVFRLVAYIERPAHKSPRTTRV